MPQYIENLKKRNFRGGVRHPNRGRRAYEHQSYPTNTKIGKEEKVVKITKGGNFKVKCIHAQFANVTDSNSKQTKRVKILKLVSNFASKDLIRQGIMTKGAVIETELGAARIVSRPGQCGIINAILVKR